MDNIRHWVEPKEHVQSYLANLKYALDNNAYIELVLERCVDADKSPEFTNTYTLQDLFGVQLPTTKVVGL